MKGMNKEKLHENRTKEMEEGQKRGKKEVLSPSPFERERERRESRSIA